MKMLKEIWFYSFKVEKKNVSSLVVNLIVWVVAAFIAGIVLWLATSLTSWIPIIGWLIGVIVGIAGGAVELYSLIGIVLSILVFFDKQPENVTQKDRRNHQNYKLFLSPSIKNKTCKQKHAVLCRLRS